ACHTRSSSTASLSWPWKGTPSGPSWKPSRPPGPGPRHEGRTPRHHCCRPGPVGLVGLVAPLAPRRAGLRAGGPPPGRPASAHRYLPDLGRAAAGRPGMGAVPPRAAPPAGRAPGAGDGPFGRNPAPAGRNPRPRLREVTRYMSMEGIRLDDGGARRNWPLMVPRALLEAYQPLIGPTATVLWLHLYSLAQAAGSPAAQGGSAAAPGTSPPLLDELARRMNVPLPD